MTSKFGSLLTHYVSRLTPHFHVVRLQKFLADAGVASRRAGEQFILEGRVMVNGAVVRLLGTKINPASDKVSVDGKYVTARNKIYLALHKPVGCVCSSRDVPPLVYDLLPRRFLLRTPVIAPVGRLDRDTSGLLLLTDDGALNHRLTAPRGHTPKTYRVTLSSDLTGDEGNRFGSGTLRLSGEDKPLAPAVLRIITPRETDITITEGRYHQVRRMFAAVGNHVVTLTRISSGTLTLGDLPEGTWRELTDAERASLDN